MVDQFFGFREQPFGVTPDHRYLYLGPGHREALASLVYGIEANRGFLALIAHPGMGKTTLLVHMLEKFRSSARTAFLFQTQCNSRELLRFLLAEFGIESKEDDLVRMHDQFNRFLTEQSFANKRVIVVIDEAQNLEPSVLETVRLLSNFETPRAKLLQIILAGQPELANKLAAPSLSQFRQRIASFSGLNPLAPQEVSRFIDHRLQVARYQGPPLFSDEAKAMIAELSEGIPRNINSLCFGALSLACGLRRKTIDTEMVREVFGDQDLRKVTSHSQTVAVDHHFALWSAQWEKLGWSFKAPPRPGETSPTPTEAPRPMASSSPTPVRLVEASPTSTEVVVASNRHRDLDRGNLDGDIMGGGQTEKADSLILRKSIPSLLSQVVGFAVLILMVGSGVTKVAAPAVEMANLLPLPNMVKIADTAAVSLASAEAQPKEARHSLVGPLESGRPVNEASSNQEMKLAVPVAKIAPPLFHAENTAAVGMVKSYDAEAVRVPPTKTDPEPEQNAALDPAELWKRVAQGSVSAEISLASLYLDGSATVQQNCEQAHQLLVVASRNGSKVASGFLNGKYAERCH